MALIRGINVGGRTTVPMAELRALAEGLGWSEVKTYIQSGNLLFGGGPDPQAAEAQLEAALAARFGTPFPVIIRSSEEWAAYASACPFPEAAENEPTRLMLLLSKEAPRAAAAGELAARAQDGERVMLAGNALWIHYPAGAGRSRLTPSLVDRLAGSPTTARNMKTVLKIRDLLQC